MKRTLQALFVVLLLLLPVGGLRAEKPADLPIPTTYVNDFAHVLTPAGSQKIEALSMEVQQKADAQLFVVTIKTLDGGMSKEEFTQQLEEKWKAGKKGQDRSAIILLVLSPRGIRIETGYGLEGILNDAKVGAILDQADPVMKSGDYDDGLYAAEQGMATVIAADKGVTLTAPAQPVHTYHYAQQGQRQPQKLGLGQILLGVGFVVLIIILAKTGNLGWAIYLVMSLMGGGGGGGNGRDDDDRGGGGFGGIGGGSSGGGGASRDF
jgi:uncharacterized protein